MTTPGPWRKARRSQGSGSACVEARLHGATPQLSDSKLAHDRPVLTLSPADYQSFLDQVRSPTD